MAAPITHIVLSEKVFNSNFSNLSREKFLVGTSFPDIRYLGVIKREQTHSGDVSLKKVQTEDSFRAGLLFHSLVDIVRENYIETSGLYTIISKSRHSIQALKLLEDEILYEKVKNWDAIIQYFAEALTEEINYSVREDDVLRWHRLLQSYFSRKPDNAVRKALFKSLAFKAEDVVEIESNFLVMINNTQIKKVIEKFYTDFDQLIITNS